MKRKKAVSKMAASGTDILPVPPDTRAEALDNPADAGGLRQSAAHDEQKAATRKIRPAGLIATAVAPARLNK